MTGPKTCHRGRHGAISAPSLEIGAKGSKSMGFQPSAPVAGPLAWQREMQGAFRNLGALLAYLGLDPETAPEAVDGDPAFPILVPRPFAARMAKGDWADPLLAQVLPRARETAETAGFAADAVGDLPPQVVPGVLHKYASRALL